jgi:hypothetical protein
VALAQACLTMAPQPDSGAVQQPCHGTSGQADSNPQAAGQGSCHYASPAVADLPIFSAADLPSIVARASDAIASAPASRLAPPAKVEPPPHSILHCCLRN